MKFFGYVISLFIFTNFIGCSIDTTSNEKDNCNCHKSEMCLGEVCVIPAQEVDCQDKAPENATSSLAKVIIKWNQETKEWEEPAECLWECNTGFKKSEDEKSCIVDDTDPCSNIDCGDNATCNDGQCICNTGFEFDSEGTGHCVDVVIGICDTSMSIPNHASYIEEEIKYERDTAPPKCLWLCDIGYKKVEYVNGNIFCEPCVGKNCEWGCIESTDCDNSGHNNINDEGYNVYLCDRNRCRYIL